MRRLSLALSITLAVLAAAASPSGGADRAVRLQDANPLMNVSRNMAIIRTQIGLGISYEQSALDAVQAASGADGLQDIPGVIHDGYAQLRFAVSGLRLKIQVARVPQPTYELAVENIDAAMAHIRTAKTAMENALAGDARALEAVIPNLQKAVQLVTLAADLI